MGTPAAVLGDHIVGQCAGHQTPNPGSGLPQPAPPMPFDALITQGCATKVLIMGKPAAVVGTSGFNTPPHVGLHPSDPYFVPTQQVGRVTAGSPSVLIEGKPAARTGSLCVIDFGIPGQLMATASTVLIA